MFATTLIDMKETAKAENIEMYLGKDEVFATTLNDLELTAKAKTLKCISFEKTRVFATILIDTDCKS